MDKLPYDQLQLREIFHLEFLRWFSRKSKGYTYALKGGTNLRFFFNSIRYSEDMDIDIKGGNIEALKDTVMRILESSSFQDNLKTFGIEKLVPPDAVKAKQTQTTQRFKVHLISFAGEDLFTKVEFSRRGLNGNIIAHSISDTILRTYKLPPLIVPHYDIASVIVQKIEALATRATIQARDIFDLYVLSSQYDKNSEFKIPNIRQDKCITAYDNVFQISFGHFRDTVISYLPSEDQSSYNSSSIWEEIQLKTANFINDLKE